MEKIKNKIVRSNEKSAYKHLLETKQILSSDSGEERRAPECTASLTGKPRAASERVQIKPKQMFI